MVFDAKVDLWFLALFYGFGVLMIIGAPFMWRQDRGRLGAFLLSVIGVLFVCVAWRASAVSFVITDGEYLDAKGWPFDGRIAALRSIRLIEPSSDPRASHAASLDRLRVDYGRDGLIFIAVEEEERFLDALAEADPGLERTATGLRRQ